MPPAGYKPKKNKDHHITREEFNAMTEEEQIKWAAESKLRTINRQPLHKERYKADRVKEAIRNKKANERQKGKGYKDAAFNKKRQLKYHHNEEYRQLVLWRKALRDHRQKIYSVHEWVMTYKKDYRPYLKEDAETFKIDSEYDQYDVGFTIKQLAFYSPVGIGLTKHMIKLEILPPPHGYGYKVFKTKIGEKRLGYYTYEEVITILDIYAKYWQKYREVSKPEQQQYLKRKFWVAITKLRDPELLENKLLQESI